MGMCAFPRSYVPISMGKLASNISGTVSRLIKGVMVAVLVPLAIGLLLGILQQLDVTSLSGRTFREWVQLGFVAYVGIHIVLYRPVAIFQASHRIFSALAVWLFGGQVASVEQSSGVQHGKGKSGGKGAKAQAGSQGSTLVAFSPYVIPLSTVLVCAAGWLLSRWLDRTILDAPVSILIGATLAFHWLMTADDLQQQRSRWHLETYLIAVGLIFVLTLLIGGACVPWAIPEFSFVRALAEGLVRAQAIYTVLLERLFAV